MLRPPEPVIAVDCFPAEREALFDLIDALGPDDWERAATAEGWTVRDVVAHLLGDDLGRISGQRDGHRDPTASPGESPKDAADRRNRDWVVATRRLSPRVLRALLEWSGSESQHLFESLDLFAVGGPVSWAGPEAAPVWLDLAREFTERWHHQQQIRDALNAPIWAPDDAMRVVLATFAFSLPPAVSTAEPEADGDVSVSLRVNGPGGGDWTVRSTGGRSTLWLGRADRPTAAVELDADTAWRMYVGALPRDEVARRARIVGDGPLGRRILGAFALVS
jgi:uncharacterized protein (TIGR03083 family)